MAGMRLVLHGHGPFLPRLAIVHKINIKSIAVAEAKNNRPVAGYGHAPIAFLFALQRVASTPANRDRSDTSQIEVSRHVLDAPDLIGSDAARESFTFSRIHTRLIGSALPARSADFANEKRLDMPKMPRPGKSAKSALNKSDIALASLDKPESASAHAANFKVPEAFHREFRMYAARHGSTMVELLQGSFRVLNETRGR